MEQRSEEWFAARRGKLTGSRFNAVMALSKRDGKPLAARKELVTTVALERLTGQTEHVPANVAMQWGTDHEDEAREWYEFETGKTVDEVGFVTCDIPYVGVSPDGLIADDGGLEIKCPFGQSRHFETLTTKRVPPEYWAQVQGCLWVSGREWWDYVSYHPLFPPHLQGIIIHVRRDAEYIERLASECTAVNAEADAALALLEKAA